MTGKFLGISRRIWCHISAATVALLIVAPITFMSADRTPPFLLTNGKTIPDKLVMGGKFQLEWDIIIIRRCDSNVWNIIRTDVDPATSFSSFVASAKQTSIFGDLPIELNRRVRISGRSRDVPTVLRPGPIVIETWQEAYCNPLQRLLDWPIIWKQQDIRSILVKDT